MKSKKIYEKIKKEPDKYKKYLLMEKYQKQVKKEIDKIWKKRK